MKICVVGAGAIGGLLGVKAAHSGHEVTLIARGANPRAIARNGMRLNWTDRSELHARELAETMTREARLVGERLGAQFRIPLEDRGRAESEQAQDVDVKEERVYIRAPRVAA